MSHINQPLVIANWKMNPVTLAEAKNIFLGIKKEAKKYPHAVTVIAPPHIYITELVKLAQKSNLTLSAQNAYFDVKGAYTGEHSMAQLRDASVQYVILGHSERRKQGETNELIAKKVLAAVTGKITPILCVGEDTRDSNGNFFNLIETQITTALTGIPKSRLKEVVIAYEPIWAIGTGATATAGDVMEMQLFIKKILTKVFDRTIAKQIRVVYGGSVNADNAKDLFVGGGINGFLVGGASLKPIDFGEIIAATK